MIWTANKYVINLKLSICFVKYLNSVVVNCNLGTKDLSK
ncbi:hypothetical protein B4U79_15725 [Dinothrombium tinctorium]|uniref:Uncharacterized protein n=1 Tax=Dinothrombium tinctorium TaxID=1965070 RepID=A0A443QHP8_9ACAR|nr:hypothetical protein B4U79_15725 [Dinothrombium tinctorium]